MHFSQEVVCWFFYSKADFKVIISAESWTNCLLKCSSFVISISLYKLRYYLNFSIFRPYWVRIYSTDSLQEEEQLNLDTISRMFSFTSPTNLMVISFSDPIYFDNTLEAVKIFDELVVPTPILKAAFWLLFRSLSMNILIYNYFLFCSSSQRRFFFFFFEDFTSFSWDLFETGLNSLGLLARITAILAFHLSRRPS